ncbi:MAG: hypothetical protein D6738_07575 [Acidobacteria bacterium]|nr:MAG: hypothetical protein D6738_07575 [Acidobacteriota bacterium]
MNDHDLRRLLRDLPRPAARPGFTEQVLARIDTPAAPRRAGTRRRLGVGLAAAALLLVAPLAGVLGWRAWERQRAVAELAALRQEQRQLAEALRAWDAAPAAAARPEVVYLGGDDSVDIVFDVAHAARVLRASGPAARPAVSGHGTPRKGDRR